MVNDKKIDELKVNGKKTDNFSSPRDSLSDNTNGKKADKVTARKVYAARVPVRGTLQTR